MSKTEPAKAPGLTNTNLQIPEALHETMKTLRHIRHQIEGSDVKLNRLYREAVEQYINARPQQKLLEEHSEHGKTNAAGRGAARV